ncbi:MAG: 4-hydroxy-tetrahydrodipicolinate reductase, partial [Clostridia bacterium]|nr:4-hydroxy-tetrahydrodipicolinate reductase [Clostridia bacterium]
MTRIIIMGMCGQMGHNIASLAMSKPDEFTVVAGVDKYPKENPWGIPVEKSIFKVEEEADVIIDFSRPEALPAVLAYAKLKNMRVVIGTTGLSADDLDLIDQYATSVPIFHSGNMSLGVNLQIELSKRAAATLGEGFEVEIVEKHHHFKVDSPSGTALMLADGISTQFPKERQYMFGRHTKTERRKPNEIGFHSVRGG